MQFPGPNTSKGHEMHCIGTGKTCDVVVLPASRDQLPGCLIGVIAVDTLWLFNIARENPL